MASIARQAILPGKICRDGACVVLMVASPSTYSESRSALDALNRLSQTPAFANFSRINGVQMAHSNVGTLNARNLKCTMR